MSGNKYTRSVNELQEVLAVKLKELNILEEENQKLRSRDRALSTFIGAVEGGVSIKTHILRAASVEPEPCSSSKSDPGVSSNRALLAEIEAKEQQIQGVLKHLGAGPYDNLYSTQVLHKATANPQLALAYRQLDSTARRQFLIQAVAQLALLLPKYDFEGVGDDNSPAAAAAAAANGSGSSQAAGDGGSSGVGGSNSSSSSSLRRRVDELVDAIAARVLVCGLLEPPGAQLHNVMVNLETGQAEPSYPTNWWRNVAKGLNLTDEQKNTLRITWQHVKSEEASLTEQHKQLIARLRQLQQQQKHKFKHFEATMEQAMQQPEAQEMREVLQLQQQKAKSQAGSPALQLQQYPQQVVPPLQQQQPGSPLLQLPPMHDLLADLDNHMSLDCQLGLDSQLDFDSALDGTFDVAAGGQFLCGPHSLEQQGPAAAATSAAAGGLLGGIDDLWDVDITSPLAEQELQLPQQQQQQRPGLAPLPQPQPQPHHHQQQQQQQLPLLPTLPMPMLPLLPGQEQQQQQQQQQVLQQHQPSPALLSPPLMQQQQQQQGHVWLAGRQQQQQKEDPPGPRSEHEEVLLNVHSKEQLQIEGQLDKINSAMKLYHYLQGLQFFNTLTRRQTAAAYVLSWPYVPDAFALCEELEAEAAAACSDGGGI